MTDNNLDTWRDRMVSALYGELEAEQERELMAAIENDPELSRDWQELRQMRGWLHETDRVADPESPPMNLQLGPDPAVPAPGPRRRRWLLPAAAGFAAAACLFVGLLMAGLRIDHTGSGLFVHLDSDAAGRPAATVDDSVFAAHETRDLVSRAELAYALQGVLEVSAARIDQMERRQTTTQAELTQALYGALVDRQQRHYSDLITRIDLAAYHSTRADLRPELQGGAQIPLHDPKENQDDTY